MSDSHFLARSRDLVSSLAARMKRIDLDKRPSRLGGPTLVTLAGNFSVLSKELNDAYTKLRPYVVAKIESAKSAEAFGTKSKRLETKDFIVEMTPHHTIKVPPVSEVIESVRKNFPNSGDLYTSPIEWLCEQANRRAPGLLFVKTSYSLKPGTVSQLREVLGHRFSEFVSEDATLCVDPSKYNDFSTQKFARDDVFSRAVTSVVTCVPGEPRLKFIQKKK